MRTRSRLARRGMITLVLAIGWLAVSGCARPLPSWDDGPTREAILAFVEEASTPGRDGFVPGPERVAVFDNDGTLWAERPVYFQLLFALDRVREMAPDRPEWRTEEPFASVLRGDADALLDGGHEAILEVIGATHARMTTDEFAATVRDWLREARHPDTGRPYTEMVYAPMLELLDHLRDSGFRVFIVSGGGADFMRVFAEEVYGVPPERVVGSIQRAEYADTPGGPEIRTLPEIGFMNDGPGKPVGIHRSIGRRPIAAFGNSDGDLEMLRWTAAGDGPSLCAIVRHTDGDREYAYDRGSPVGRLEEALDEARARGWVVIDMARDWSRVFAWERGP